MSSTHQGQDGSGARAAQEHGLYVGPGVSPAGQGPAMLGLHAAVPAVIAHQAPRCRARAEINANGSREITSF